MGKEILANTERQAGLAVPRSGSAALAPLRCRQSGAGFLPWALHWGKGGILARIVSLLYHFAPGGTKLIGRLKSFLNMHMQRMADPNLGCGPGRGSRRGDSGARLGGRGRGLGFEFGLEERERTTLTYAARHFANHVLIFKGSKCDERTQFGDGRRTEDGHQE